jgi:hypothetical protein
MKRAILAAALAAALVIGGYAAYVYLYEGALDVRVKDAVGTWSHVDVTFTQVWIHEAGKADDVGWHNVSLARTTVDLASLVSVSDLLASARFAPGKYTQIRIVVASATGQMTDGTTVVFTVPSGELKTTTPFEIRSGRTTTLTVDIDLSRSIVATGNGSWTFTPVLGPITVS